MPSSIRFDAGTVADLALPVAPDRDCVEALFTASYHRNLLGLRRLRDFLVVEAAPWVAKSDFDTAFEVLRRQPAAIQRTVLAHPSACFWTDVAYGLIARGAHERFPDMHFTEHLAAFARFAAAAVLLSGRGTVTCTARTDVRGRVSLPGAGVVVEVAGAVPCGRVELIVRDGVISAGSGVAVRVLSVARLPNGVELNSLDHDLRLGGRIDYLFEDLTEAATRRWTDILAGCWSRITALSPALGSEMTLGIRALVPVTSPDRRLHLSGSFHEAPGMVTISLGTEWQITEALVHEHGHQKLNALMNLDPLVVGPTTEAMYYSPWRDDARPLTGVLHAVYTFTAVLGFYQLMPDDLNGEDGPGLGRAYRIGRQVEAGIAELRDNATLSPFGSALVDALERQCEHHRAAIPAPPSSVKTHEDDVLREHRERWRDSHPYLGSPGPGTATAARNGDGTDQTILFALGLPGDWSPDPLLTDWYPGDVILDRVRLFESERRLEELSKVLAARDTLTLVGALAAGHSAYVVGDYTEAASRYAECVRHAPTSPYLWQCFAFALRHRGHYDDALYLLTHIDDFIRHRNAPDDLRGAIERERRSRSWALRPRPSAAAADPAPLCLPRGMTAAATAQVLASKYRHFVAATQGGAQLPALIAVAAGLKPAMDVWIPYEGWPAFEKMIEDLPLEYYVDAYFDRDSDELRKVPPEQLTTTRAGFSAIQRPGTEAHVFLARDSIRLDEVVGTGWYPLAVNGHIVNKHRADHDKFGDTLGYPRCCQEFFRQRNNWHNDNTYFAALRNTGGRPSVLCNPFLRHTLFGLISYMPCSYDCARTAGYAETLLRLVTDELPEYARAMTAVLSQPILCVSELKMYRFDNAEADRNGLCYTGVETLYPIEAVDPLLRMLEQGNRCELDGTVVRIDEVGCYPTRGDKHGPEYPFLIGFAEQP
ncbi:aKG-HExxH-type peptide beta-hydroxylase [Nocardia bovistercoris]|uniref:HEXXH motif domain-containing protein n=1 Tax=Nocardia bovistercoris TaxID=2785916 RepID=A0A931I8I3_9NOCA|nr:HEXXH motif-containing putative peptide modification protein [Nocardia bovistercoris]MBH0776619.1 hypothetical protein [Nocardia bovistercoris]